MKQRPRTRPERRYWRTPQVRSQHLDGLSSGQPCPPADQLTRTASARIGYVFNRPELLLCAVTHRSFANEAAPGDEVNHNERLEFLGDAVLNLIISQMLMNSYDEANEGQLSRMRAFLVCERELAKTSSSLQLGELLRLGKGEDSSGGRRKSSLLANVFEAVLGAVFIDGGLPAARKVVERTLGKQVSASLEKIPGFDPKSWLQELFQREGRAPPSYRLVAMTGPEHQRRFTVAVFDGEGQHTQLGQGEGSNKKEAEQSAARDVLRHIEDGKTT